MTVQNDQIVFAGQKIDHTRIKAIRLRQSAGTRRSTWRVTMAAVSAIFTFAIAAYGQIEGYHGVWPFWVLGAISAIYALILRLVPNDDPLFQIEVSLVAPDGNQVTATSQAERKDDAVKTAVQLFNQMPTDEMRLQFAERYNLNYVKSAR